MKDGFSVAGRTSKPAYRHPSVKEVAVFGVADDAMGEELAMVCRPQPGSVLTEA
jgi:long-chain acyl-CoA synthetase